MKMRMITCPRCFVTAALAEGAGFCPRCGLAGIVDAAPHGPLEIVDEGRICRVLERVAIGSISTVYRCQNGGNEGEFKVARDACTNDQVANEAEV